MEVTEILLPGVGVCYEFQTSSGPRVGVVAKRDGHFDFVRYEKRDPDAAETLLTLTRDEADTLAEILGAPRIVERFADLTKEIPGLSSANIYIPPGSRFDGRTLGDTRSRSLTGASIVAIGRGEHVIASPGPNDALLGGDTLIVVGTVPLFLLVGLVLGDGGVHQLGASTEFIRAAGELGVLLLLLLLGLEFSAEEFTAAMRRHAPSGVVDLVLNAPVGFVTGLLLGYDWQACLALAGVTWISSSGIVARLLSDLQRTGFRETPAVLSVLVLEDIAMAVFLPLLVVMLAGGTGLAALLAVGAAVAVVLVVLLASRHLGHHLGKVLGHDDDEQVLLRVLGLMLLVAGLTYFVDASAAVGAFLVGLAIPSGTAERARDVLRPLRDLFAALFFLSFGLETSPAELTPFLAVAFALAVVSSVTKVGTGVYAARRDGVGPRGRARAGTVLTPRGSSRSSSQASRSAPGTTRSGHSRRPTWSFSASSARCSGDSRTPWRAPGPGRPAQRRGHGARRSRASPATTPSGPAPSGGTPVAAVPCGS